MVTINAGGVSEGVFESELFGHVKGAFTDAKQDRVGRFEMADGSSLFLDEIANVPLGQQQKLLRVLETGEFDVWVFTDAEGRRSLDLGHQCRPQRGSRGGTFRQDLLFRLNTIEIHLPPLRDRREDIPRLAACFLTTHARTLSQRHHRLRSSALRALVDHRWPERA